MSSQPIEKSEEVLDLSTKTSARGSPKPPPQPPVIYSPYILPYPVPPQQNYPHVEHSSRSPIYIEPAGGSCSTSPVYYYADPNPISPLLIQNAICQQVQRRLSALTINEKVDDRRASDAESCSSSESHNGEISPAQSVLTGKDGKITRPFKAYPKDPLALTSGIDPLIDTQSNEKYCAYREKMMAQICAANGGTYTVSNPKMRRTVNTNNNNTTTSNNNNNNNNNNDPRHPGGGKDTSYAERRKKNNAAAKKSRDRRKIKEDEIAIRATFLEHENMGLKFELAALKKQLALFGFITSPKR